jgi:PAS domain S-box-containing protein
MVFPHLGFVDVPITLTKTPTHHPLHDHQLRFLDGMGNVENPPCEIDHLQLARVLSGAEQNNKTVTLEQQSAHEAFTIRGIFRFHALVMHGGISYHRFLCNFVSVSPDVPPNLAQFYRYDVESSTMICSDAYAHLLGYADALSMPQKISDWFALIHPEEQDSYIERYQTDSDIFNEHLPPEELRLRRTDGTYVWVLMQTTNIIRSEQGKISHVYGRAYDINERKALELKSAREAQRLQEMIDNAPFPIYKSHADYRCDYVNKAYTELTGLSTEQACGYGWLSALKTQVPERELAGYVQAAVGIENTMLLIKNKDGADCWVRSSFKAAPERAQSDLMLGMLLDVSDQIRDQDALKQRTQELEVSVNEAEQHVKSKSEFLAVVSHEIRWDPFFG